MLVSPLPSPCHKSRLIFFSMLSIAYHAFFSPLHRLAAKTATYDIPSATPRR
jgi:hypothetical protein